MTEAQLQEQVVNYLRYQFPDVIFHSDFGSGIKMTPGQAAKQRRQQGGQRGWPDLFVAHIRLIKDFFYAGLFIELKKEGTRLKKKDGTWATPHIAEQAEMLDKLQGKGYKAVFCCGFTEAQQVIDKYLK